MGFKQIDIYTDGSYHDLTDYTDKTYGAIYLPSYEDCSEWQFFTTNPTYVQSRNVGGEILAAEFGISLMCGYYDEVIKTDKDTEFRIDLYYDYEGVGKWLTGEWRRKKVLTQAYYRYVDRLLANRNIKLFPHHVDGHAGNAGNERADYLAREAYNSERCYDANSFVEGVLK